MIKRAVYLKQFGPCLAGKDIIDCSLGCPHYRMNSSENGQRVLKEYMVSIMDDILIYSNCNTMDETIQDDDKNLKAIMEKAKTAHLVFNAAKI